MIRWLGEEEKALTRPLYEEAFPDDIGPAADFYYETVMRENRVIAEIEGENVSGMLCLNPYRVKTGARELRLPYIVAVATEKAKRRRGIMRRIMTETLKTLYAEGLPFVFLKPADPAYYTPFFYAYASVKPKLALRKTEEAGIEITQIDEAAYEEAAEFMDCFLSERADVFCIRDKAYMKRLAAELAACGGHAELLKKDGRVIGTRVFDYAETEEEDARSLVEEAYTEECGEAECFIMMRLVRLEAFFSMLRPDPLLADGEEKCFYFRDDILGENGGVWCVKTLPDGSHSLFKTGEKKTGNIPQWTPETLIPAAAGFKTELSERFREETGCLPLRAVYFDEET